jgi:hypothetical protein
MKKRILAIVTCMTLVMMVAPSVSAVTIDELMAQIAALQAQLVILQGQVSTPAVTSFTTNLSFGMRGAAVTNLQNFLIGKGHLAAGLNTGYFGPLTKAAVMAYQTAKSITPVAGYFGPLTRAAANADTGGVTPSPSPGVSSGLGVSVAYNTPASATIISYGTASYQGQVLVPFVTVAFTAGPEGAVKVTNLKFTRTGISSDANLDATYLYEGDVKLAEGGTISSKVVTFNNAAGIFTVPAGTTKYITLKGNLSSAASAGTTIGFNLAAATDVTSNATTVSGTFPASGNLMTVATVATLGWADIARSNVPSGANTSVNLQNDYLVWSVGLKATNQKLNVEKLVFTEVGSIASGDLVNFKLYQGGTLLGTVASMNANNEVVFDLSASPSSILSGATKTFELYADIVKGSTKTFKFTLQSPTDLLVKDTNYGVYVPSYDTLGSWTLIQPDGYYTIAAGSLSVVKSTSSPTGNVPFDATGVSLAKYDFKAVGEDVKVSNLRIDADTTGNGGIDNGMVYLNGVQVGSTIDLTEHGGTPTTFTFGTSFVVPAGTTAVVEVKGDIKTKLGVSLTAGDTVTAYLIYGAAFANGQGTSSLTVFNVPTSAADVSGNALTVKTGTLTFTKSSSYGNQSTTAPSAGFKVGSFQMLAGSTEGVSVNSITVAIENDAAAAKITNLMLKIGTEQIGSTKVIPGTSNLFSVNVSLAASQAKVVDIYADILAAAVTYIDVDGFAVTGTGTTTVTSTAANATSVNLQIVYISTGALSVSYDAGNVADALVVGATQGLQMAKYKFASAFEAFTVSQIKVYASSETDRVAPRNVKPNFPDFVNVWLSYKDSTGATITTSKMASFVNGMMDFTGLSVYVPANGTSVVTIYADMNYVAPAGYAMSGDRPEISLAYYKASSGSLPVYERHTGKLTYAGTGATIYPMTWVDDGVASTAVSSEADGTGTNALAFIISTRGAGTDGAALDIPLSDLNLTVADFNATGARIQYYAKTTAVNEVPSVTLYMDCGGATGVFDGSLDGEITYSVNQTIAITDVWHPMEYTTVSEPVTWWSYAASTCGTSTSGETTPVTLTNSKLRATNKIIGASFSTYGGAVSAGTYQVNNLVLITGVTGATTTYNLNAVEDDMGNLGTNYVLYGTKPVVTRVGAATETTLTNGTQDLYRFNIAADNAGDVAVKGIVFSVTASDVTTLDTLKLYKGSTDYTGYVTIGSDYVGTISYKAAAHALANATHEVFVVFTDEEIIAAGTSRNYTLKGVVTGVVVTDSITTYIQPDTYSLTDANEVGRGDLYATMITSAMNNFVWSDRSYGDAGHSLLSYDWTNGFLVDTLGDGLSYTVSK